MDEWVRAIFDIVTPFSYDEPQEHIRFGKVLLPLSLYLEHYGHLTAPPTYDALVAVDPNNARGWNNYFAEWRDSGIIR